MLPDLPVILIAISLLVVYVNPFNLSDLPPEILDLSLSHLSFRQQMDVRRLNRGCDNCFEQKNKFDIIQTRLVGRMIDNNDIFNHAQLKMIHDVSHNIQLTELYSNKLPKFIQTCYYKLIDINNNMKGNDFALLMNALNLHSIGISEFNMPKFQNLSSELRCLLLSSRALLHHLAPTRFINLHASSELDEYPWLLFADHTFGDNIATEYIVYFCLLYQYVLDEYHEQLSLPSLDSMHHAEGIEHGNVMRLIDAYGFIPWNRNIIQLFINETIIGITNISYDYFDEFVTDTMFMQLIINVTEVTDFLFGFRTYWVLSLMFNDMMHWDEDNQTIEVYSLSRFSYIEKLIIELSLYNFNVGEYDKFEQLVYCLAVKSPWRKYFNLSNAIYYDPFNGFYSRFIQSYMGFSGDEGYLEKCSQEELVLYYKSISNFYFFQKNDTQKFIDIRVAYCHLYDMDEIKNIIDDCYSYITEQHGTFEEQKLYFRTSGQLVRALLECRNDWNIHQDFTDLGVRSHTDLFHTNFSFLLDNDRM